MTDVNESSWNLEILIKICQPFKMSQKNERKQNDEQKNQSTKNNASEFSYHSNSQFYLNDEWLKLSLDTYVCMITKL